MTRPSASGLNITFVVDSSGLITLIPGEKLLSEIVAVLIDKNVTPDFLP